MHKDRQLGNVDFSLNEGYFIVRKRKDGVNRKNMATIRIYKRRVLLIIMILTVSFLIIYQSTDGYIGNLVARKDNRVLPLEQLVTYNRATAKSALQKYKKEPFWIQDTVNVTTPGDVSLKAHQSRYTGNLEAKGDVRMLSVEKLTLYNRTTAKRGTQQYKQDADDMQNVTTDLKVNSNSKSVALGHDTNEPPRSEKRQTSVDIKQDNYIPLYIKTFIQNRTVVDNEVQYSNLTAPSLQSLDKEIPLKRQNYSLPSYNAHLTIGRGSYFKIPVPNDFLYIASAYLDTRFNRRIVRIFGMRRWNQTVKVRCSFSGEMATQAHEKVIYPNYPTTLLYVAIMWSCDAPKTVVSNVTLKLDNLSITVWVKPRPEPTSEEVTITACVKICTGLLILKD